MRLRPQSRQPGLSRLISVTFLARPFLQLASAGDRVVDVGTPFVMISFVHL
jgi:hypothetical protein